MRPLTPSTWFLHADPALGGPLGPLAVSPGALVMLALAALFAARLSPGGLRREGDPRPWELAAASAAFLTLAIVELPPFAASHDNSLTLHMVQHMLIIAVTAPLLALADPLRPAFWALPASFARRLPRRAAFASNSSLPFAAVAWGLAVVALYAWHAPPLFDAASRHFFLHALEHLTLLATSFLLWWVVFRRPPAGNYGLAFVLVFASAIPMNILAALTTFAAAPWYALSAPPRWGLTPLQDQQVAGVVMWVAGEFVYVPVAAVLFARWLGASNPAPAPGKPTRELS